MTQNSTLYWVGDAGPTTDLSASWLPKVKIGLTCGASEHASGTPYDRFRMVARDALRNDPVNAARAGVGSET
jgi:hypothetical protein